MSRPVGVLNLSGRGGQELFVFDDCLVQATTGLAVALSQITGAATEGTRLLGALTGSRKRYAEMSPDALVKEHASNRLFRVADIGAARLARGRWPSRQVRLTLTLPDEVVVLAWPGNGATRPLNHDEYAVELLRTVLGPRLASAL